MGRHTEANERPLDYYREYLHLLVRLQLPSDMVGTVDASDIVQQALLKAHERQDQYRGQSEGERAAWLRSILANTLTDALRRATRERTVFGRSLEAGLEESSSRLEAWLSDGQSGPEQRAERNDQLRRLAESLAALPEEQRTALELRHLRGWTVAEICKHMDRTTASVAGLLRRGLRSLRERLE
jgi:RNA polymerase sigma-70 factor (ECF subfamily)